MNTCKWLLGPCKRTCSCTASGDLKGPKEKMKDSHFLKLLSKRLLALYMVLEGRLGFLFQKGYQPLKNKKKPIKETVITYYDIMPESVKCGFIFYVHSKTKTFAPLCVAIEMHTKELCRRDFRQFKCK